MRKMIVTEFIIGKIAAEDIYNRQGTLLLKAGNMITEVMVSRLEKEKIAAVWVK
ncbi:hypothetical protein [Paenibacillus thalictri]|uniref:hypothetical protein n=1 Tax=Paenibacillus thalictri TaxID=2527873 RepID=UPI0013EEFAB8|nr:hypothetical protein [Paenibacillus thalictri]